MGGRPLQSREIHDRVMELLTTTAKKVFSTTTPRKTVELLRLGEAEEGQPPRLGIKTAEVRVQTSTVVNLRVLAQAVHLDLLEHSRKPLAGKSVFVSLTLPRSVIQSLARDRKSG